MSIALLEGTTLTVETSFTPPVTIDLAEEAAAPPGLVTRLFRPRYTLKRGATVLLVSEPVGPPARIDFSLLLLALVVIVLVLAA